LPIRRVQRPSSVDELSDDFHLTVLTQYHMNKRLILYSEQEKDAVLKKFKQLDVMNAITPTHSASLSVEDTKRVLEYLMFPK